MTRFRLGQRWKREPSAPPVDSIALELDGMDLLSGAGEEPLAEVVPTLVGAAADLHAGRSRLAQVSLAEAGLELVLRRAGVDIEVSVVSLGRPARLLRPPVRVDLEEFTEAARECGEGFRVDLSRVAPDALSPSLSRRLDEALRLLGGPLAVRKESAPEAFTRRVEPSEEPGFGFELKDPADLLRTYERGGGAALGSLLCAGEVWLALPGQPSAWRTPGPPFLTALELSRQALELARAVELGEPRFAFEPAGVRPGFALELASGKGRLGSGAPFAVDGTALAAAMFHLGQALALAISERERSQASNPYLVELTERCREGLSHLRGPVQPPESTGEARGRGASSRGAGKPLPVPGRLRRLRFERRWEQKGLAGAEHGGLHLGRQGVVFCSRELACGLARKDGQVQWRREAAKGVAATVDGYVVAADADRVYGFVGAGPSARWLHDHDGLPLGPQLMREDGLLLTLSEERTVLAFAEVGGREVWRLAPPRTQRSWLATQGHRALVATDSGYLYGVDIADGQVRFRMRAPLPFHGTPVAWGKRFVATLGRGTHHALLLADAHTGDVTWTREFQLSTPSAPLPVRTRVYLAGVRDQEGLLLCLDSRGKLLWERPLHMGVGPFALTALPRGVLVTSASGAAVRVDTSGELSWRVGAVGEPLASALPARASRGVVLIPGEQVRAVDPKGGQVLAEVQAGAGLVSLQADARLGLYFLDDAGTLSAYRLGTHFTVVEG
ncbi:PQQ-binding-like beta-propeller repeat protein [Hyalangium rubrum]|uniref:PQQ-binding-like beta-propeller repeat protein n=1 Tax=Hyalangium rubrum TaxID=3103134 RepID=A0ABU5H5N7_9BACT|nr:PQQ-binding-like beta-propeller repeat protein [Hyalangium sp. s54d21]MDY7228072.1 PQQ-binding-like beta-propeller repeat protein [Hyalangium sp. s54d21]